MSGSAMRFSSAGVRNGRRSVWYRTGVALILGVLALVLIARLAAVRDAEARLLAAVMNLFGGHTSSTGSIVWVPHAKTFIQLVVTSECSVGLLIACFLACAGVLCWFRPAAPLRIAVAVAVLCVGFVLVNQVRLSLLALVLHQWGATGAFRITHVLIGSLISMVGFVAGLWAFVKVLGHESARQRKSQQPSSGSGHDD